jgi:Ice-binding-like
VLLLPGAGVQDRTSCYRWGIVATTKLEVEISVPNAGVRGRNEPTAYRRLSEFHAQGEHVIRFGILVQPLIWFTALLLTAFIAGCGSGGGSESGSSPAPSEAGAVCSSGAACVPLGTAGHFAILSVTALTNVTPSVVTGDVGLTKASGTVIGLTCPEVTGAIYSVDAAGPLPCRVTAAAALTTAETDADNAYIDATGRAPDVTGLGAGDISGKTITPGVYKWTTGVAINTDVTLTGGPNDVWIFQIGQGLSVGSGVKVILAGGALPQNVYWASLFAVELGTNSQFRGVLLPAAPIFMMSGASIDGRLLAFEVHLDHNTVTRPGP